MSHISTESLGVVAYQLQARRIRQEIIDRLLGYLISGLACVAVQHRARGMGSD